MVFYEFLRDDVLGKDLDGTFPLWYSLQHCWIALSWEHDKCYCQVQWLVCVCTLRKGLPCGMLSGAAGQFLASPTDLIKVRMQMDGRRELEGLKPRYSFIHVVHIQDMHGEMCCYKCLQRWDHCPLSWARMCNRHRVEHECGAHFTPRYTNIRTV